ncbi:hypothetical protein EC973_003317 [Apophysomyces ossiformis]|uniref:uridine/cytidine kinase n=1 Tax=Apophysomyces ossiformis TaxID=679940 RepID=A0A8H7EU99_9FUNG|nr:hypothetical protein EC973_003317 [Apophysomyces ossiformis]
MQATGVAGKQKNSNNHLLNQTKNNTWSEFLGGSASGKTSVAERILKNLNVPWVVIVSMDSFYNVLSPEDSVLAHQNFCKHAREEKTTTIYGANVIIFEGIFALYDKKIRDLMDLKMLTFVWQDDVMQRDIAERGREIQGVLDQYTRFVKPSFDEHVQPTVKHADVIIPRGLENVVAIDLITKHVQRQLNEKQSQLRWDLLNTTVKKELPQEVLVLPQSNQIKGIHTILRNKNTCRDEFVFYAERLSTLIVETGLSLLPFEPTTVVTPQGASYSGLEFKDKICGVSLLRAGSAMETGLRRVCNDVLIGKILIQTDPSTGEPQLHYLKLPPDVKNYHVVLMDATIGTGAAGLMALRVLLDHDVPPERIIFMTFLATPIGLNVIANAFPRVKIVTSMVDPVLSKETLYIEPGIGNFGDRYFGTEDDG